MSQYVWENALWVREGNKPTILIFARDVETKELKRIAVRGFKPYFYVADPDGKIINCFGKPVRKIICNTPDEVAKKRKEYVAQGIETFEGDILFEMRYFIDKHITYGFNEKMEPVEVPLLPPRVVYYDIEVNIPEGEGIDSTLNQHPIVAISVLDSYTDMAKVFTLSGEKVHPQQVCCESEKDVIESFCKYVGEIDPDILTGWYCVPEGTLVDGKVAIENLIPNSPLSVGGRVLQLLNTGNKECVNINTSMGWKYTVGREHRILVSNLPKQGYVWKHCDNYLTEFKTGCSLSTTDVLHVPIRQHENNIGLGLNLNDCYKAGFIYADGCVKDKWRFGFYQKDKETVLKICDNRTLWFSKGVWCSTLPQKHLHGAEQLILNSSGKKELNYNLMSQLSVEEFGAFVAGWYDGDGCGFNSSFTITDNKENINHFNLFCGFGVISTVSKTHTININKVTSRFLEAFYNFNQKPMTKQDIIIDTRAPTSIEHFKYNYNKELTQLYVRVRSIEDAGVFKCYDITTSDHIFSIGCVVHNCLDFDMPYILGRAEVNGCKLTGLSRMNTMTIREPSRIHGRTHIDMLEFFKDWSKPMGQFPTYDLKYISKHFAGFEYSDHGEHINRLIESGDWKTLIQYSVNDVIALAKIDGKAGLIKYHENLRKIIGVHFSSTILRIHLVETLLMRYGIKPMPSRKKNIDKKDIEGALVIQPSVGIKENVIFLDAKSLYPSIILAFNLSPDVDKMIPKTITYILAEREKYRALKLAGNASETDETTEQSLKYIANSFYGVMGSTYFKLYDPDIAARITRIGREINQMIQEIVKEMGYDIIYGDTDSVAISPVISVEDGKILEAVVNERLAQWGAEKRVAKEFAPVVKFEKFYKKMFFKLKIGSDRAAKKKYVGHLIWKDGKTKDQIDYTGIEIKRSDSAPLTKSLMENFFHKVLIDGDVNSAIADIKAATRDVYSGRVNVHDIAIPKGMHSTNPNGAWQKGVAHGIDLFNIKFDSSKKPKLIYCKSPYESVCIDDNISHEDVVARVTVDWKKMCDRVVLQKMRSLIESVGHKWENFEDKQTTLDFGE